MAKRKKQPETKAGAPAWMVTYSDMTTLLLTFFVLLLSFANTDLVKYKEAVGSLKDAFGVQTAEIADFQARSSNPVSLEAPTPSPFVIVERDTARSGKEQETEGAKGKADTEGKTGGGDEQYEENLQKAEMLKQYIMAEGLLDEVGLEVQKESIIVRAKTNVFFLPGSVKIQDRSYSLLKKIAFFMKETDYYLSIEGHTDNTRIKNNFPSNWELSAVRATTILRAIKFSGVSEYRLRAIGYSDTRPIVPNTFADNRAKNRRVEFIFTKEPWK